MSVGAFVLQEIRFRKASFSLGTLAIMAAAGCLAGSLALLRIHDLSTARLLEAKRQETVRNMNQLNDDIRKAMLKLGLNLVILPKEQKIEDWYADDSGSCTMDEQDAATLMRAGVISVQHLLPIVQKKVLWPEQKRRIILVGTRGEVPNLVKRPKDPLVNPVPEGGIVLGHELHSTLGLKQGDKVRLLGEEFTVSLCHDERGTKDDITAWISLSKAQQFLGLPGRINAIVALQCVCTGPDILNVREDIARVLPHTQVIELGTERRLARLDARAKVGEEAARVVAREKALRDGLKAEREQFVAVLLAVVIVASGVSIATLSFNNVLARRAEIGVLSALGYGFRHILGLFLLKALAMGLMGGALGLGAGLMAGRFLGLELEGGGEAFPFRALVDAGAAALVMGVAVVLSLAASWLPSLMAARQDPAVVLRGN